MVIAPDIVPPVSAKYRLERFGISPDTRARKKGVPVDPAGAARKVLEVSLANTAVSVPVEVTGEFEIVKTEVGRESPMLVTVPEPEGELQIALPFACMPVANSPLVQAEGTVLNAELVGAL